RSTDHRGRHRRRGADPTRRHTCGPRPKALPAGEPSDGALRGDCLLLSRRCGLAMPPLVHRLRVRYNECDAQGHVFNANYFVYFDVTLTELWRETLGSYEALTADGLDLVVAETGARFRA